MLGLELILIVVLQFEGTRGTDLHLYHRPGDDVVLPCNISPPSHSCSSVDWIHSRFEAGRSLKEISNGKVDQSSPRAVRLNVDSKCSLIINNITAEDVGAYRCRLDSGSIYESAVFLNVLTISPCSPPSDPSINGEATLLCSLKRYSGLDNCPDKSFRWLDDAGTELTGEDVGYNLRRPSSCVSSLTVKLQSSSNRRYTCQFVEGNTVKIEAHYPSESEAPSSNIIIITGAVIGILLLLASLSVAVFIKCRKSRVRDEQTSTTEFEDSGNESHPNDETQSNLTYVTANHFNPKTSHRMKVKQDEDTVTYSAVRT